MLPKSRNLWKTPWHLFCPSAVIFEMLLNMLGLAAYLGTVSNQTKFAGYGLIMDIPQDAEIGFQPMILVRFIGWAWLVLNANPNRFPTQKANRVPGKTPKLIPAGSPTGIRQQDSYNDPV